jgi:hypothetical protein
MNGTATMMMMMTAVSRLLLALALLPGVASAQAPKPASTVLAPVAAKPDRTTANQSQEAEIFAQTL